MPLSGEKYDTLSWIIWRFYCCAPVLPRVYQRFYYHPPPKALYMPETYKKNVQQTRKVYGRNKNNIAIRHINLVVAISKGIDGSKTQTYRWFYI